MEDSPAGDAVRVAADPGWGRLARRGRAILFVPEATCRDRPDDADDLFERFERAGSSVAGLTDLSRCVIDWSNATGDVIVDTSFELWARLLGADGSRSPAVPLERWPTDRLTSSETCLILSSDPEPDALTTPTDLRDGVVHARSFGLVFDTASRSISVVTSESDPPLDESTDLDATLTPAGSPTYPEDDVDRTSRRASDLRCRRGHANAGTRKVCRVCGDSLDATIGRARPRSSSASAGVRLPDGTTVPINRTTVIGRSPSAQSARLDGAPRLVSIEAPGTVSRTHVVIDVDGNTITVTDCEARGRTAVTSSMTPQPVALIPWEPHVLAIGDAIQLGGPTTLTITDPSELRVPPDFEATALPPEREETT